MYNITFERYKMMYMQDTIKKIIYMVYKGLTSVCFGVLDIKSSVSCKENQRSVTLPAHRRGKFGFPSGFV